MRQLTEDELKQVRDALDIGLGVADEQGYPQTANDMRKALALLDAAQASDKGEP